MTEPFDEKVFIWALTQRVEEVKKFSGLFNSNWLHMAELQPVYNTIISFTKEHGLPPGIATIRDLLSRESGKEVYESRYKPVLDSIESSIPDNSFIIHTLKLAQQAAMTRSFEEMIHSQKFMKMLNDFDGTGVAQDIERWRLSFLGKHEDLHMPFIDAVDRLAQSREFTEENFRVECGIHAVDRWIGGGMRAKNLGIWMAPTGHGKCHGQGTKILMHNGSVKNVENIVVGDVVMGPDSLPRVVRRTHKNFGELFKIVPKKGSSFVCNKYHTLSLRATGGNKIGYEKDEIVNIDLDKYLKVSKTRKHVLKLWRTGVAFPETVTKVDPYVVGVYLGDGFKNECGISLGPSKVRVREYIKKWAHTNELHIRTDGPYDLHFSTKGTKKNWFRDFVKTLKDKNDSRIIPEDCLVNSEKSRLKTLAGLLDTDGSLEDNCYEITTKSKPLSENILFLTRSLGFASSVKKEKKGIKATGFVGEYYRIRIWGDVDRIPCLVEKKKARSRKQKKNHLRTGFDVEQIENGMYYGFEVDRDKLYLLGDFTVSHNTATMIHTSHYMAIQEERNVWFISNELEMDQITERFLSRMTGVGLGNIMEDPGVALTSGGMRFIKQQRLHDKLMVSYLNRDACMDEIESELSRFETLWNWKPEVIVIDYMERMRPNTSGFKRDNSWIYYGEIAKDMSRVAKRRNCVIWSAIQTNRAGLGAKELMGNMAQGSIQHLQEATNLIGLHQPNESEEGDQVMEFKLIKARESKLVNKTVKLVCDLSTQTITDDIWESPVEINRDSDDDVPDAGKWKGKGKFQP